MHKRWLILLMTLILIGITGCGKTTDSDEQKDVTTDIATDIATDEQNNGEPEASAYVFSSEPETDHETIAFNYVTDLFEGDYEALQNDYTLSDEMNEAVSQSMYQEFKDQMDLKMGSLQSIFDIETVYENGFEIVNCHANFDIQKLTLRVVFDGQGNIAGFNTANYTPKSLVLYEDSILEQSVVFGEEGFRLNGVITTPKEGDIKGVIILVHGSGPSDKNESVGLNEPFKDLAWGLAKEGIATFRYDKRTYTYGQKLANDTSLTPKEEVIDDVTYAEQYINVYTDLPKDNVYVLGHSLGGHLIPEIAKVMNHTKGYIFMAANTASLQDLVKMQYDYIYGLDGTISEQEKESLDALAAETEKVSSSKIEDLSDTDQVLGAYKAYWEYLNAYDPITEVKKIQSPMLFLQGENDYQVPMSNFVDWQAATIDSNATYKSYPGLNHLMMYSKTQSSPEDYYTKNTLSQDVITDIAEWIKAN